MVKAMNPELKAKIDTKMNEIKEIIREYSKQLYGDAEIEEIEIKKVDRKMNDGTEKHELTIDIDTAIGYFRLEDVNEIKNEENKKEEEEVD